MPHTKQIGVVVISVVLILFGAALGVPCLLFGSFWFIVDIILIATGGGGNLNGLGIFIGLPIAVLGIIFSFGIKAGILLLMLDPRGRRLSIIFLVIAGLIVFNFSGIFFFIPLAVVNIRLVGSLASIIAIVFLSHPRIKSLFIESETSPVIKKWNKAFVVFLGLLIAFAMFVGIQAKRILDEFKKSDTVNLSEVRK